MLIVSKRNLINFVSALNVEKAMPEIKTNNVLVKFKNADITNGDITVIEDFTFSLRQGEFVYLTGKVGSGKTSIIRAIIGDAPVACGYARVGQFDLMNLKRRHVSTLRRHIGIVFQDFKLLMDRSVEDNLRFVLKATDWKSSKAIEARITDVLTAVGLEGKGHKMPYQLSGGEQQRVAIARALLNSPQLILADEPTGNLDIETARGLMELLRGINARRGTAILMVTHNLQLIREFPSRVLICEDGICTERDLGI